MDSAPADTFNFTPIRFRRAKIFSFEEFLHGFDSSDRPTADISYITGCAGPVGQYTEMKRTVINDISPSAEDILRGFNDSTRNAIHQISKNGLCTHQFITAPTDQEVVSAYGHCSRFCAMMGIPSVRLPYLRALRIAGRLCISYVYDQNNVILVGHGYRLSRHRPELAYSFRIAEHDADKMRLKLRSNANRYSHYRDMLELKSAGYGTYDFGGLSDGHSDNLKWKQIDEFKMYFGGKVVPYHNSILYNTIKSKTYLMLRGNPFKKQIA